MKYLKYWIMTLLLIIGLTFPNNTNNELSYNNIENNEAGIYPEPYADWDHLIAFDDDGDAECETDADCAEGEACIEGDCEDGPDTECVTDADCAEGEACIEGDCEDGNDGGDNTDTGVTLTFGEINFENSTVELLLSNSETVAGFQFVVASDNPDFILTGASGGLCEEFGLDVHVGDGTNVILSFSEQGNTIPAGTGVATLLSYTGADASEICITESIVSNSAGDAFDVTEEGCVDFASLRNGDMNADGTTNVLDIVQLVGIILSGQYPNETELFMGDINDDGLLNVLDVIILVSNILGDNLGRTSPINQSTVEFGNGIVRLSSDGEIAGIQLYTVGEYETVSTNLPSGWLIQGGNGMIVMVNMDGSTLGKDIVLEYTGNLTVVDALVADWSGTGMFADKQIIPTSFDLQPAYPNPFNPSTQVEFSVPYTSDVQLIVFNMLGQTVAELANGQYDSGTYSISWNAGEAVSGMYFIRINVGEYTQTQKVMLLK